MFLNALVAIIFFFFAVLLFEGKRVLVKTEWS